MKVEDFDFRSGFGGFGDDYLKLKYKNTKGLPGRGKLAVQALFSFALGLYLFFPAVSGGLEIGSWFSSPMIKDPSVGFGDLEV